LTAVTWLPPEAPRSPVCSGVENDAMSGQVTVCQLRLDEAQVALSSLSKTYCARQVIFGRQASGYLGGQVRPTRALARPSALSGLTLFPSGWMAAGSLQWGRARMERVRSTMASQFRDLKRALARAKAQGAGGGLGQAGRTLAGLQRRVSQALASDGRGRGRGRGAEPAAAPKPRRKVTDPEVLERRRAALAKARAARAAKRAAGG
jgi:hypothetical protein